MRRLWSCRGQDEAQQGHRRPEKAEVGGSCSKGTWTSELAITAPPMRRRNGHLADMERELVCRVDQVARAPAGARVKH